MKFISYVKGDISSAESKWTIKKFTTLREKHKKEEIKNIYSVGINNISICTDVKYFFQITISKAIAYPI